MKTTLLCATVLLMAVSASTKVCVLRNEESKCSVRGEHVSEEEAVNCCEYFMLFSTYDVQISENNRKSLPGEAIFSKSSYS